MAYADFEYYANTYLGTAIEYNDFSRLSLRASAFLDYYTQGRAAKNAELDALKMCCCAIAEQYQYIDTAKALAQKSITSSLENNGELQSQTVGSWSKTYRSGGDSAQQALSSVQTAQAALATIAQQYLAGTGLLYRGRGCPCVPSCCDGL
jgi:hypothetical protein